MTGEAEPPRHADCRTYGAMPERVRAIVTGRVQGVGFRDYVERRATALDLRGAVRNRPDGTVEVIAEGDRAQLDELLGQLQEGPPMAAVDGVNVERGQPTGDYADFRITY